MSIFDLFSGFLLDAWPQQYEYAAQIRLASVRSVVPCYVMFSCMKNMFGLYPMIRFVRNQLRLLQVFCYVVKRGTRQKGEVQ